MRKLYPLIIAVVAVTFLLTPSCMAAKQTVGLGQEFQLSPGQTASVTGQSLSIEFVRITDDSRCPTGVT
jgi:hypothetical protein